ncbi:MAG: carboxypeptidase-like regulatory domain-containing protein, partial [Bacteroidota bacterium]
GLVKDAETGQPIAGVLVQIEGKEALKTVGTDEKGIFRLEDLEPGRYKLTAKGEGFQSYVLPDLLVHAGKQTVITLPLQQWLYETEDVTIADQSYRQPDHPSVRPLTVEESKRFAGVYFDPARVATSLPGVIQANDQANNLIVRGNSPNGILWRLEGVDIVNPNHLSNAGTFTDRISPSGGGTIILSSQLLGNSTFSTGAFSSQYGNALSGVFDMNLRAGNNEDAEYTLQAGLIGVDLSAEGPISREKGSAYLVNYRYSFTGLLGLLGVTFGGEDITYQDLAFNLRFPTAKAGTFTFFGMGGLSSNIFTGQRQPGERVENKERFDIEFASNMAASGITHEKVLGNCTLWRSVLAVSGSDSRRIGNFIQDSLTTVESSRDRLVQQRISFNTSLTHSLSPSFTLKEGIYLTQQNNEVLSRFSNTLGQVADQVRVADTSSTQLVQPYIQGTYQLSPRLRVVGGLHAMFLTLNQSFAIEPRLSLQYQFDAKQRISFAYGLHSQQQLPQIYYFQSVEGTEPNRDLGFTRAHHLVLSYRLNLGKGFVVQIEPYAQFLYNVPVKIGDSSTFSTLNLLEGFVTDSLANLGTGRNIGVDFSIEKTLFDNYYVLLSGAIYDSKFTDYLNRTWDTRFNGQYNFALTTGYERDRTSKKGKRRSLGANIRVIYAGGFRTQPIDLAASREAQQTVFDDRAGFTEDIPDYFRIDFRLMFKRHKKRYTRSLGIDIQNAANTQNVAFYTYDAVADDIVTKLQLGIIPLLTYRLEF